VFLYKQALRQNSKSTELENKFIIRKTNTFFNVYFGVKPLASIGNLSPNRSSTIFRSGLFGTVITTSSAFVWTKFFSVRVPIFGASRILGTAGLRCGRSLLGDVSLPIGEFNVIFRNNRRTYRYRKQLLWNQSDVF
jgi:hypothetical protein